MIKAFILVFVVLTILLATVVGWAYQQGRQLGPMLVRGLKVWACIALAAFLAGVAMFFLMLLNHL
jgi:uncharacterized membrane protein